MIDHGWLLEQAPEYRKYVNTCPTEVCGCECPARGCRDALRDARSDRNCGHDGNAPASSALAPLTRSNPELPSPPPDTSPLRRHFSDRARHSARCHSLPLASTRFYSLPIRDTFTLYRTHSRLTYGVAVSRVGW